MSKYQQKFRSEWKTNTLFNNWISEDSTDKNKAFCKYCKCSIVAKISNLRSHAETEKHKAAVKFLGIRKIPFKPISIKTQEQEAALALFICQHSSISTVDHLTDLCKNKFSDSSTCTQMQLHRSKCTGVIKNVLAKHFIDDLQSDIGDKKFSLLIDESTDIGITKLLGIVIIYFSEAHQKVISTFLSMAELASGNADGIVDCLKSELTKFQLKLSNLIGIGTDNANVMIGCKKSVFTELKKEVPHLILIRCACHSIQLAINYACKQCLPNSLEYIVNETYNWFSKSYSRQQTYKKLYGAINNGLDPLKITRVCDTRWLSIEVAISRILEQWLELKTHFNIAKTSDKCFMAESLYMLYNDEINYGYLLFLKPILLDLQMLNKSFQSNSSDPTKLITDLTFAIKKLINIVTKSEYSSGDILSTFIENRIDMRCYLGYTFETWISDYKLHNILNEATEGSIRKICIDFVVTLVKQLQQRLPENYEIMKKVDLFSVEKTLSVPKENIADFVITMEENTDVVGKIVNQYKNINFIQWINTSNTSLFWVEVHGYKDSAGNNPFAEISKFSLELLSLPWSNADVERTFSQLNIIKTKIRNRLQISTLNAILHIRYGMKRYNKCCHNYQIPSSYYLKIGTNAVYESSNEEWIDL